MEDYELLDQVKIFFGLETDASLADYLNVDPSTIANIRAGRASMGDLLKIKLLDKYGFSRVGLLVEMLTTKSLAKKLRSFHHSNAKKIALRNKSRRSQDGNLLNFIRECSGILSDEDLSKFLSLDFLKIKRADAGKTTLELKDRLKIVEALYAFDTNVWPMPIKNISEYCSSAENLLNKLIEVSELTLLDGLKKSLALRSDNDLAEFLGVSKQHISAVRKGSSKIGIELMVKIFGAIEKGSNEGRSFDADLLMNALADTGELARVITELQSRLGDNNED